jgi:hypothetical protein
MTYFHTCIGCKKRSGCNHLKDIKDHIGGFGITSVKHRCPHRESLFLAGDPVIAETRVDYDFEDGDPPIAKFKGWFIAQSGTKGIVFIQPGETDLEQDMEFTQRSGGKGYVKILLTRIEADETRERMDIIECGECGQRVTFVDECCCGAHGMVAA